MPAYLIHDNGGRPFLVKHGRSLVRVYKECEDCYTEQVLRIDNPLRVFVGKNRESSTHDGNTMLVHVKGKEYVYIGESIYSFGAVSPIQAYVSDVGNSDVPYAYALDAKYTYLLIGSPVRVPTSEVSPEADNDDDTPYDVYYAPSLEAVRQRAKGRRVPHLSNADAFNAATGGHAKALAFKTIVARL
jgi:hypothetical protein